MHQITLTVSQNVLVNHTNEHSCYSMYSKCPLPACTHDLRWWRQHRRCSGQNSKQVYTKSFRRSSISWIFVSYMTCCITPQISKRKAHGDPGPLWWSHDTSHAILFKEISRGRSKKWRDDGTLSRRGWMSVINASATLAHRPGTLSNRWRASPLPPSSCVYPASVRSDPSVWRIRNADNETINERYPQH